MTRSSLPQEKDKDLSRQMKKLKIYEKDVKESFVRASGPGGQNVNKVSTCVILRHVPTGIQVKCQSGRTQAINRHKARRILIDKVAKLYHNERLKSIQEFEKRRRQERRRPKFLKEDILEKKHKRSEKKKLRKKIALQKFDPYM